MSKTRRRIKLEPNSRVLTRGLCLVLLVGVTTNLAIGAAQDHGCDSQNGFFGIQRAVLHGEVVQALGLFELAR